MGVGRTILYGTQKGRPAVMYTLDRSTSGRLGCYLDSPGRVGDFEQHVYSSDQIHTPSMCRAACSEFGHPYAAMRHYHQCWCGRTFGYALWTGQSRGLTKVGDAHCEQYDARGDRRQRSGGATSPHNNIYKSIQKMDVYETNGAKSPRAKQSI